MALLAEPLGALGRNSVDALGAVGRASLFLAQALSWSIRPPYRLGLLVEHMRFIGNRSISIVLLTSTFTGMVLVLQGYNALVRFGSEIYLGPLVALSLIRELGPVLAALMVTARAGSAMAATIAGMRVTEQIDALEVMAVEPVQYLASTRLLAAIVCVPLLVTLFNLTGIGAAYVFATEVLGVDGGVFISSVRDAVSTRDVAISLYKALVFAVLVAWIACFQGYYAQRGARGIGRATTQAVVIVSVLVLAGDYVMTALLL
ncbi:MAG: MlaE family lipid ABC transporter permease subunit [Myxococcota bacterium]